MSPSNQRKAVALRYQEGESAPVIVASGMGHLAERIVEVAADCGVPIYEDNSLATMLTQLQLGEEIPPELYQLVVDIYVYFLNFNPNDPEQPRNRAQMAAVESAENAEAAQAESLESEEQNG